MTWIKLNDDFPDHPKIKKIYRKGGSDAVWLHVAGMCHCSRFLTDGFISEDDVADLTLIKNPDKALSVLTSLERVWDKVPGGYQICGYLEHQRSRESIEEEREASRRRQAERRAKSRRDTSVTPGGVTAPDTEESREDTDKNSFASDDASETKELESAFFDALGFDPKVLLTSSETNDLRWAAKQLHTVGATPFEIFERVKTYRERWPDMVLTARALVKHWSSLATQHKPCTTCGAIHDPTVEHQPCVACEDGWIRNETGVTRCPDCFGTGWLVTFVGETGHGGFSHGDDEWLAYAYRPGKTA